MEYEIGDIVSLRAVITGHGITRFHGDGTPVLSVRVCFETAVGGWHEHFVPVSRLQNADGSEFSRVEFSDKR
jgi:hypothetical protein